nr:hypothetical protein [Tanacetum cinerariifolium]
MDHYTKKALWIYWIIDDGEVELTYEESSDDEDKVAEIQTYLLRTLRDSKLMKNLRMIGSMNGTEMYHRLMRNHGLTPEFGQNQHQLSIIRRWQSYEITYHGHDEIEYENETHNERQELYEAHELPMCNIRRFMMIKYSFRQDEKYVAVKEDEYNDWQEQTMMHAEHTRKSFAEWTNDGVFYKVEDIATYLVKYVKYGMIGNDCYGNAKLVIIKYLVNISKRRALWSLNEDILKIIVLTTNTSYPSRKLNHIRVCTHQRPQKKQDQYAVSREDQYAVLEI